MEDLHAALGCGKYSARQVLQKLTPELVPETVSEPEPAKPHQPAIGDRRQDVSKENGDLVIKVKGIDDLLVYRAKCCNPIRGESIVRYVTRGKGIAGHSTHCSNVQNLMYEVERARSASEQFPVKLVIYTGDRPGMLNQLISILFAESSNIRSLEARSDEKHNGDGAIVEMTVEIKDKRQLEKVTGAIRRIPGVRDIERVQ